MKEIKLQCDCGQKIKFDVDPSYTQIPFPVNCPVCGADCLDKANQALGATAPAAPVAAVAAAAPAVSTGAPRLRIGHSAPAPVATVEAPVEGAAPTPARRAFPARPGAVAAVPADGKPKRKPNFALGFAGTIAGAIIGGALFYLVFKLTGFRMGVMGLAVGFLVGLGGRLLGGEQEGNELGVIAGTLAVAGIIGAQYFVAHSWWNEMSSLRPSSTYEAKVEEAKKVVAAVPTGSEQEIRVYLAKELSDQEDEKVAPSQVDAGDVKQFKETELPQFQDLASGKITKADYEKQHAAEIAEEKKEKDSEEGTFKAVFVILLLNRVSLACLCGGAALAYKMCS